MVTVFVIVRDTHAGPVADSYYSASEAEIAKTAAGDSFVDLHRYTFEAPAC